METTPTETPAETAEVIEAEELRAKMLRWFRAAVGAAREPSPAPECPTCKGSGEVHVTTFSAYTGDESDPMECDACEGSGDVKISGSLVEHAHGGSIPSRPGGGSVLEGSIPSLSTKRLERLMVTCPSTVTDFVWWLRKEMEKRAVDGWRLVDVRGRERPDGTWLAVVDVEREATAESDGCTYELRSTGRYDEGPAALEGSGARDPVNPRSLRSELHCPCGTNPCSGDSK